MRVDLTKPLTLENKQITVGEKAPDFCLARLEGFEIIDTTLKDFEGKVKILSCYPSIDTGVCDLQTKNFYKKHNNNEKVALLNISTDLLFALSRWCGANEITNATMLSDYRTHRFAKDYGINILGADIIYRSIFIIDENNTVRYVQLAKQLTSALDFDDVDKALQLIL